MIRLGGAASPGYIEVFSGLATYFAKNGLEMDWVLYSSYDTLVEAFERKEIDIAWNGPLSYIKIQRSSVAPAVNVAMRDVDRDYLTHLIVRKDSGITALDETRGKKLALGSRSSVQAGVLPHYYLKELGFQPETDFSEMSFYEERSNVDSNDELDVAWKVVEGEYDAGAISNVALDNFLQNHKQRRKAHPQQAHHATNKAKRHKAPATADTKRAQTQPHPHPAAKAGFPVA